MHRASGALHVLRVRAGLALLALVLLLSRAAPAAIAFVPASSTVTCATQVAATPDTWTLTAPTTAGNDAVIALSVNSAGVYTLSVSDDGANSYVSRATINNAAVWADIWTGHLTTSATAITIDFNGGTQTYCLSFIEYSGVSSAVGDGTNISGAASNNPTITSTVTATTSFLVSAHAANLNLRQQTATSGTLRGATATVSGTAANVAGVENTGSLSMTNTTSFGGGSLANWAVAAVELKAAAGGGGGGAIVLGAGRPVAEPPRVFVVPRGTLNVSTFSIDYLLNLPVRLDAPYGVQVCQQLNPQGGLVGTTTIRCIGGSTP